MSRFQFKPIHWILLAVFGAVLIVSVSMIIVQLVGEHQAQRDYNEISEPVEIIIRAHESNSETTISVWSRDSETSDDF